MRRTLVAGFAVAALSVFSLAAEAAPVAAPHIGIASDITTVSGGCGPRGFRAANGRCYPRRPPPPVYRGRRCPPGMHLTPYGCRRNF